MMDGVVFMLLGGAIILLAWFLCQRVFGEIISPVGIFFASSIASFALYRARFVAYNEPSLALYGTFIMMLTAFAGGAYLADPGLRRGATSVLVAYRPSLENQRPFLIRFL